MEPIDGSFDIPVERSQGCCVVWIAVKTFRTGWGWREEREVGLLCQHLAGMLFGEPVFGKSVDISRIDGELPGDTES